MENFENSTIEEIGRHWGHIRHANNLNISNDIHRSSPGLKSLSIKQNGHLFTHHKGVDTVFARFYVKFHEKTGYIHHFVQSHADLDITHWPKGRAGLCPKGDDYFAIAIEPKGFGGRIGPPGIWCFYNYWHNMRSRYGTRFYDSYEQIIPGRWYCIEIMIKANSGSQKKDGSFALWVDGRLRGHFTGFWLRTTDDLKINCFWLLYYNTPNNARFNRDFEAQNRVMEVWFDDIVIATNYIGPIVPSNNTLK